MHEFHYKFIGRKDDNRDKLLFTDTDILVHETETDDVNEDFYGDNNLLDFSDYSKDPKFF